MPAVLSARRMVLARHIQPASNSVWRSSRSRRLSGSHASHGYPTVRVGSWSADARSADPAGRRTRDRVLLTDVFRQFPFGANLGRSAPPMARCSAALPPRPGNPYCRPGLLRGCSIGPSVRGGSGWRVSRRSRCREGDARSTIAAKPGSYSSPRSVVFEMARTRPISSSPGGLGEVSSRASVVAMMRRGK